MEYYQKNKHRFKRYPQDLFEKLEFDKVLQLLSEKCQSSLGKEHVERMRVMTDPAKIEQLLTEVNEFKQLIMDEEQSFPLDNYLSLREELGFLEVENTVLNEEQVFRLYKVLEAANTLLRYFQFNADRQEKYPNLFKLLDGVKVSRELLHQIKEVIDKDGKVRSDASKELISIRKSISQRYKELDRQFVQSLREYKNNNWLADSVESIRNGRRVLAVLAEYKRKIRGIIHDESKTGSIAYIEPDVTLQINNDLVGLQLAEKREIYRILQVLTQYIRPYKNDIQEYQTLLGIFDFIHAKAQLAWDMDAHLPHISREKKIELFNARHPLLFLKNKALKKKTVPLSFELSLANRILLVSGPNAGGKSVMLKTVGLLQLMLQSGLLVPLNDHSFMTIFQQIFVDIGDEQSIENDLSTYSSRLRNMHHFIEEANAKTLLLMDEFGSGTDPALGGAIAEAVLEHLNQKFCYGVVTTHYSNLKVYASETTGIFNGCMTFDYKTLSPKYILETGKPGSSFAFELAVKSGMSETIIKKAKSKVDTQYQQFDELLTTLQREKSAAEEKVRQAAKKEEAYKKLLEEYEVKKRDLELKRKKIILETEEKALAELQASNKKFENLVKELKENKGEKQTIQKIKKEIQKDRVRLSNSIEILKDNIYYKDTEKAVAEGDFVRLRTGREVGEVTEFRKNKCIVQFDSLKTLVKTKELVVVEPIKKKQKAGYNFYNSVERKSQFENSIDIRGQRRVEALKAVEDLIDEGLMYNADELKVIHGIGDGILRRSIRDMLRTYKAVKSVRDEDPQYGGAGVSIIELG